MSIIIEGLKQNNLKDINLSIPKNKLVVFVGLSGSGKSSIVFDTIAAEAQRQLFETYPLYIQNQLPHYSRPNVKRIENLGASVVVAQEALGLNARTTIGTTTDIYTLLRMLYLEEGMPKVKKMAELSFNSIDGMCEFCSGLGDVCDIDLHKLVNQYLSWKEGCIEDARFSVGSRNWKRGCEKGGFNINKKFMELSQEEKDKMLYGNEKWEGVYNFYVTNFLKRDISNMGKGIQKKAEKLIITIPCPHCKGTRLNEKALRCKINGYSISDLCQMDMSALFDTLKRLKIKKSSSSLIYAIEEKLEKLIKIGLGYLSLNRQLNTLSGGESQRLKIVKYMGSSLIDMTYIFDEPSVGMHPYDLKRICELLRELCDKGNTVLVVEHNSKIISMADHIIEVGPGAGKDGGNIVFEGSYTELLRANTITAKNIQYDIELESKQHIFDEYLQIKNANINNLKNISIDIPRNVLIMVTGVAGSGKSSLFTQYFYSHTKEECVLIDQKSIKGMNKSNIATYMGFFDKIRKEFAEVNGVSESLFSFNAMGACPKCNGKGYVEMDLVFNDSIKEKCEVCNGTRYSEESLKYLYKNMTIIDILALTVEEALDIYKDSITVERELMKLKAVGLEYLSLGQSLDTLSGGEKRRLKLAKNLGKKGSIYIVDEPTSGLHLEDCKKIVKLFYALVERGNTVIMIEHNLKLIKYADWIVELGPEAGNNGGKVVFNGKSSDFLNANTITARCYKEEG